MSTTVNVRIEIAVKGPVTHAGKPVAITYEHERSAFGDNPRFYAEALVEAVRAAAHNAIADIQLQHPAEEGR